MNWYKLGAGGRDMVNFYTYLPGKESSKRKQTRHRLEGINVVVSSLAYCSVWATDFVRITLALLLTVKGWNSKYGYALREI